MAQRLLLEGSDIDELLARVRSEHGPHARIVHAEQKLVGGVGGFFARRRYEVAVAIDDDPADIASSAASTVASSVASTDGAPRSLEELLAVADAQDRSPAAPTGAAPTAAALPATALPATALPATAVTASTRSATASTAPTSVPGTMALTEPGAGRVPGRALSTESASFDHLVRDLVARAAPETRAPSGFAASVAPAVTAADAGRVIDLDQAADAPRPASPAEQPPAEQPHPEQPHPEQSHPEQPDAEQPPAERALAVDSQPAPRARPAPAASRPVPPAVLALGLPVAGPEPAGPPDHRTSLLDVLAEVAVPAPTQARGVQLVVGPEGPSRQVADAWLRLCGQDSAALVDLSDPAEPAAHEGARELAERLERLAFQRGGVLVVVPAGDTRGQARSAGRRIAGLPVDAVTAVVDARWDSAVTQAWLDALGEAGAGASHLAAHGVGESLRPLRLLEHALPVTWLDARPATLGVWAGPCLDRWNDDAADEG